MKTIVLTLLFSLKTFSYFPVDYNSSRERFLRECTKLKSLYSKIEIGKINVKDLSTDYFYLPATSSNHSLIIITSGTHGPESFAGSALQQQFIEKTLPHLDLSKTSLLMIHAHNPWGFKHIRRGTENNVNLNRNYALEKKLFKTKNKAYKKLRSKLEMKTTKKDSFSFPALSLLWMMLTDPNISQQSMTEAIGKGQYEFDKGINYGGNDFEPQVVEITKLLKRITPQYSRIFNIDIHTGLGDEGVLHVMSKDNINEKSKKLFKKMFNSNEKKWYHHTPPGAKGFYEIKGDYSKLVSLINPEKEKEIINITAEFGTVGNGLMGKIITINRLINENQGHFVGYENEAIKKEVQRDYKNLFYPNKKSWNEAVLKKGHFLLDTIAKRFLKEK